MGLGIAGAVYLGVRLLLPEADPEVAPGVRRSQLVNGLAALEQRLVRVTQLGGSVVKPDVRQRVDSLIATSGRVIAHVREDPADLHVARPLLELYLDSTASILTNYVRLASRPVASAEEPLAKAENEAVPLLEAKVTELYDQLQREEVVAPAWTASSSSSVPAASPETSGGRRSSTTTAAPRRNLRRLVGVGLLAVVGVGWRCRRSSAAPPSPSPGRWAGRSSAFSTTRR